MAETKAGGGAGRPAGDGGRRERGGGLVAHVEPGSPAAEAGILAGDLVLQADGRPLRDVLDWRWAASEDEVTLLVTGVLRDGGERDGGSHRRRAMTRRERAMTRRERDLTLHRIPGQGWGIEFSSELFDEVKTCGNACVFCFVSQLPSGMRSALYVRDDDFRLSFTSGNFITLGNLSDEDMERIRTQRLSPLYVSLHSADPEVRARLGLAHGGEALRRFDELLDAGIELHVQVVLVPGVNDGAELERTLDWLEEREGVLSVGFVPMGYTAHQRRFTSSYERPEDAAAVLRVVRECQARLRKATGRGWVYAADELYLAAGEELPALEEYDGFPQYENGIGIARAFIDEMRQALAKTGVPGPGREVPAEAATAADDAAATSAPRFGAPVTLVTGELAAPVLERATAELRSSGVDVRVLPVENRFFGGNVSVAGLLTGRDLIEAISRDPVGGIYLVPSVVLNTDGVTLDDVKAEDLPALTGKDVRLVDCDAEGLLTALVS